MLQPQVASFSLPVTVEWPSCYSHPLVRAALQLLVRRHAVLRTFYAMNHTGAIQMILPTDGFAVPLEVCREADWPAQSEHVMRTPFALTKASPMRALLMCSEVRDITCLLVVVDHVAADYASTLIIAREIRLACDALHQQSAPSLSQLTLQYADWTLWRQRNRVGVGEGGMLEWWQAKLAGAPQLLDLPLDRPRVPMSEAFGSSTQLHVNAQLGDAMRLLCHRERVSKLSCLLATWAALLMQLSGQDEIVSGQPYSLQLEYAELQNVVGCFATPIPVRVQMASTFRQLLRNAYIELLHAMENADVPLFRIVEVSRPQRSETFNPLFQTIVQLLPRAEASRAAVSKSDPQYSLSGGRQLQGIDLFLNLVEDDADGSLSGELIFNEAILDHATLDRLLVMLIALLRDSVEAPNVAMHNLPAHIHVAATAKRFARRVKVMQYENKAVSPFEIVEEEMWRRSHAAVYGLSAMPTPQRSAVASPTMPELLETVLDIVQPYTQTHVAPGTPLMDAGLNSLNATQLSAELERQTGLSLSPILIFQYSTAEAIVRHLHSLFESPMVEQPLCTTIQGDTSHYRHSDVSVSGTSARWPHGAASDRELTRLADATSDAVSQVPASRWLVPEDVIRYPAVAYVAHVPNAELFDSASFAISPAEALWMDPQQRLLLEKGYTSLHASQNDAGRGHLLARNVAVLVGIQANDFATISMSSTPTAALPVYAVSGSTFSVAAGRLSYVLGMQGACYNTDTACSTALVAAHAASTMVRVVECESALVLAVNLLLLPLSHLLVAIAGMTSADGRCKFLDSRANGYVRSEGVGAMLLEPKGEVVLVRGSAVRSDGKSASLTAPNGEAQVDLLRAAMLLGALVPEEVQTTECHGTGTALGDPIETTALWKTIISRRNEHMLSGVKASVGHMEPSAGMVGFLKLYLTELFVGAVCAGFFGSCC